MKIYLNIETNFDLNKIKNWFFGSEIGENQVKIEENSLIWNYVFFWF